MDRRYALRVAGLYALAASVWIAVSDIGIGTLGLSTADVSRLSLYKGFLFVVVTSMVLYSSVVRAGRRYQNLAGRLATLIEVVPIPIVALDLDSRVTLWNPAAERVFGWTAAEVIGERNPIVPPEDWEAFLENQRKLAEAPNSHGLEARRRTRDGRLLNVHVFNAAVRDDSGAIVGTVGVLEDVTQRNAVARELERHRDHLEDLVRERTEELTRMNEELSRATDAKDTFLASMSHELRTPLNSIIGFTQILLQGLAGDVNEEQTKQLQMVNASGRHLLALINDVLDLSKIESGRTSVRWEPVRLQEITSAVAGTIQPLIREKGLTWTCECDADAMIVTDRQRVEQILLNLLSNAVKFTETGGVRLSVAVRGAYARFEVADTGVGVAQDALERIFGEFVQIESTDSMRPEGTGLGLAISRRLAALLGGTLVAASEVGVGSTFVLTLPVGSIGPGAEKAASRACDVLVVDDDVHARMIVTALLRDSGYHVREAADGARALEAIAEKLPDAIMLDLVMPKIDGWGVVERLKAEERTADIPIICASIMHESEVDGTEAFAGFLVKPIDAAGMLKMLDTVLSGRGCTGDADREGPS